MVSLPLRARWWRIGSADVFLKKRLLKLEDHSSHLIRRWAISAGFEIELELLTHFEVDPCTHFENFELSRKQRDDATEAILHVDHLQKRHFLFKWCIEIANDEIDQSTRILCGVD